MKANDQDVDFQESSSCLSFKGLPPKVRERLLSRQRGEGEGFAIKTGGINSAFLIAAAAASWFGLLYLLTNASLWNNAQIFIFGSVSLFALYLLLQNLYKIFRWFASGLKCYLLITPIYVIDIEFDEVRYWNLEQLLSINSAKRAQNAGTQNPQITLTLKNKTKTITAENPAKAEEIVEQTDYLRKKFIEATVRNDLEYLNSNDDFIELKNQESTFSKNAHGNYLQYFAAAAIALVLTIGVMFGAISLNNYFDDKNTWTSAQTENRASSYRNYLKTHPKGRWINDATAKLQSKYDLAEELYKSSLKEGYDQDAVDAVLVSLKYAKTTGNYCVKLEFEKNIKVPPNLEEEIKKEFEVKKVLPLGDVLSNEKMTQREDDLFALVGSAFREVIADDVLEISRQCSGDFVRFLIKYEMDVKYTIYFDVRQEKLSDDEKVFYPGILIDWKFETMIPNQPEKYNFELESVPADEITYDSKPSEEEQNKDFQDILDNNKGNIYNSMVSSAFGDFKAHLLYDLGLGKDPHPEIDEDISKESETKTEKKVKK